MSDSVHLIVSESDCIVKATPGTEFVRGSGMALTLDFWGNGRKHTLWLDDNIWRKWKAAVDAQIELVRSVARSDHGAACKCDVCLETPGESPRAPVFRWHVREGDD